MPQNITIQLQIKLFSTILSFYVTKEYCFIDQIFFLLVIYHCVDVSSYVILGIEIKQRLEIPNTYRGHLCVKTSCYIKELINLGKSKGNCADVYLHVS